MAAYRLETRRSSERIASEMNAAIVGDKDREPVRARTVHRFLFDPDITPSEFTIADVRDFLKHLEAKAAGAATEKPRRTRVS